MTTNKTNRTKKKLKDGISELERKSEHWKKVTFTKQYNIVE